MVQHPDGPPPAPSLPNFKLAEKLGQGAFGSVYKGPRARHAPSSRCVFAFTLPAPSSTKGPESPSSCAASSFLPVQPALLTSHPHRTQIDLSHIPKAELPDIMSEIDLLKNLHHPNIVQYRGYARTDSALYIVLEYCENGSLSALMKKFGRIPESLVGLYTLQVLQGLQYLHDQGVIHRDIKGSNILATKEGSIKLADFGVATRVGGPSDLAVVGSPYWMAPEVVDQSGATLSSDIWSLGALVIELITGKPPYHFLDPMPALFRIVNDDCPPLPDGASAVVRDFLLQCFQKDANLRIGAKKLLRHPWMVAAKRQADQQRRDAGVDVGARSTAKRPTSVYDDTVQKVQEWNEALRAAPPASSRPLRRLASNGSENLPSSSRPLSSDSTPGHYRRPSMELASALKPSSVAPPPSDSSALSPAAGATSGRRGSLPLSLIQPEAAPLPLEAVAESREDGEADVWDSDFEEGISMSKIAALDKPESASSSSEAEDESAPARRKEDEEEDADEVNSITIRPLRKVASLGGTVRGSMGMSAAAPALAPVLEDYSDLVGEDEADPFAGRVKSFQEKSNSTRQLLRPDASNLAGVPASPDDTLPAPPASPSPPDSLSAASSLSRRTGSIAQYSEVAGEGDDYSDVFGTAGTGSSSSNGLGGGLRLSHDKLEEVRLSTRLSNRSWLGDEDSDEDDPFALVDQEAEDDLIANDRVGAYEENLEVTLARDKLAQQCALVSELIDTVAGAERLDGEWEVREAALQLTGLLEDLPEARTHFVKSHGMLVVLEALRIARSREILSILLRIVNLIVGSDAGTLEKIALVGGCPVVMSFSSKRYTREIRLEAALFIGSMCRTSLLTLQMFVSCQGLRTLVDMLDESYAEGKDLVWMAVDGLSRVFETQGPTPRNDFCRILSQEGLLDPLSSALLHVCGDDDDLAESAKAKIVQILLLFAQSDHKVKEAMARRTIALRLVKAATLLEPELLAPLLKTIKNLSMLPAALDVLQNAGAIDMLVETLGKTYRGRLAAEIQNHAVNTLFNLCRLSKARQEEAAAADAVPLLQQIVRDNSPLKQFALPILCDFAHAGKVCRKLLWHNDGVAFYLQLLKDTFWVNPALEAILAWLQDEPTRVEECLLQPLAIEALVRLFCKTRATVFDNLLEPLHKILRASSSLASRLAVQSGFLKRIVERLERASKAVVRLNLLRITKTVFDALSDRRDRDKAVKVLAGPVGRLAEEDKAVLSRQLAKSLAAEFTATREETKRSLERRAMRRAASESGTPLVALASSALSAGDAPSPRRPRPLAGSGRGNGASGGGAAATGGAGPPPASPAKPPSSALSGLA
ncbi:hypothetical protein JCM8097_000899, partial [Rhodosporidiobolus ruineniae]